MSRALSGVGLALVEVPRFRAVLARRGAAFEARVFTPGELAYAHAKRFGWQNLAARFAAKLAGRAALRDALGRGLPLAGFEVARKRSGEPELQLLPRAGVEASFVFRLSLTHDADFALASVLAEAAP
ncbi:MAG TPA: 4'-phosphopantetheinyl transferase superfamily protein [Myxococcota bacterium]|nr:4'-phosphopantetheinyl transferase superfamily protein [Myxococcota bacterium]